MGDITGNEFAFAVLAFRVIFGLIFAGHGWSKRKNGLDGTAAWFDGMGMKPGRVHAQLASLTEIGTEIGRAHV